jgi:predicted RNA-binding Zn ribbon-like protein
VAAPVDRNAGVVWLQPVFSYTGVVAAGGQDSQTLAVLVDFLNTRDERSFTIHGTRHLGGDEIATRAMLAGWLAQQGLIRTGTRASGDDLREAHALRDALRGVLADRAGRSWDGLPNANKALAGLSLRLELGADGTPHLSPLAARAVHAALARVAASVATAAADGSWQRLKMCAAPDCGWVFHDTSRNGLGRWCSMQVCGNRDKTRAYRQRHGAGVATSRRT